MCFSQGAQLTVKSVCNQTIIVKTVSAVFFLVQVFAIQAFAESVEPVVNIPAEKSEIIPPPPPGPYISSALSDYSVNKKTFHHRFKQPAVNAAVNKPSAYGVPMAVYSPDRPWPENLRGNNYNSGSRGAKNDYRFERPGNHYYRNPRGPGFNWPGRSASGFNGPGNSGPGYAVPGKKNYAENAPAGRWLPSMSMGQRRYPVDFPASQAHRTGRYAPQQYLPAQQGSGAYPPPGPYQSEAFTRGSYPPTQYPAESYRSAPPQRIYAPAFSASPNR